MLLAISLRNLIALAAALCCAANCCAQDVAAPETDSKSQAAASSPAVHKANNNMVPGASLNLQTTITGNQEQPRVFYILPWQSPAPEDVDFEAFDTQQKATFSHIEREELRRELESANE